MGVDGVSVRIDSSWLSSCLSRRIEILLTPQFLFRHFSSIVDRG
jgi:hypothetical protein